VSDSSQFSLLTERRFAPFFSTQFLGAFNDNIFRNGLIIVITFQGVNVFGLNASQLANIAGALFILPFIGSFNVLFLVLFLMGCQSTLFGPVKYAYLPQQLASAELVGGNALVESGTYLAIIFGLIVGGVSVATDPANQYVLSACLISVAILGYMASRGIPETRAVDPALRINWNAWKETWHIVGFARENRSVFLSILGISWFWFFGSAMTLQIPAYTLDVLNGNEEITTILLVAFAVGVGIGSLLCERLSGHRIELGLVPFGSIGMSLFAIDLYFAQPAMHVIPVATIEEFIGRPGSLRILFDLAMLGAFGGLYSVPLYAMIQERAKRQHLSRIIAANNIINALFMVGAAVLALGLLYAGLSIPQFFIVIGILNAAVAVYIYSLLPEFLMRFIAWTVVNTLYRIRTTGLDNVPDTGPAVLVCNHVSYVDALVIGGSVRRPVRFVMWYKIFDIPLLKFIFRTAKAIPIASAKEDPALLEEAFAQIDAELEAGNIVCIFPEGGITRDGDMQTFRPGIEKIIGRRPVPIIPIGLGGLWGSWFSRHTNGRLRRLPGKLFSRVDVRIGDPVKPSDASAAGLEMLVRTLRGQNR
jgi:1-acyl-sn-glycerol-3-phosphate acyltransferase